MKLPQANSRLLPSGRLVVTTALVATVAAASLALSRPASLTIDGQRIISDVPPVTQAREAFVPLRAVAQGLGADANYDPKTGAVELVRGNEVLRMRIGDTRATINGHKVTLRQAPFAVRGRTMVALGVIAQTFGSRVRYDRTRANIDVVTPGVVEAGAQQDTP
jgi:N-acetylmuramoyl-L-alanine amidase